MCRGRAFRERSVSHSWEEPRGGVEGDNQSDVYLSTGQQSANGPGRLNPLSLATSLWHGMKAHSSYEKTGQTIPGHCGWGTQGA